MKTLSRTRMFVLALATAPINVSAKTPTEAPARNVVLRCVAAWDLIVALPGESYSGNWCEGAVPAVRLESDGAAAGERPKELVGTLQIEKGKLRLELARDSASKGPLWLGLDLVSGSTAQPLTSTQAGSAKATVRLKRRDDEGIYLYMDVSQPLPQTMQSVTRATGINVGGAALASTKSTFSFAAINVNGVIALLADGSGLQAVYQADGTQIFVGPPSKAEQAHTAQAEAILALAAEGKLVEARKQAELALAQAQRTFGKSDRRTADSIALLAEIELATKDWKRAETLLRESLDIRIQVLAPLDADTEQSNNLLAKALAGQGKIDEAMRFMQHSIDSAERAAKAGLHGRSAPRWSDLVSALILQAELYANADNIAAATQALARARKAIEKYGAGLAQAQRLMDVRYALMDVPDDLTRHAQQERSAEIDSLAAAAYALARKNLPLGDSDLIDYLLAASSGIDNEKAAEPLLVEALELLDAQATPDPWQMARTAFKLAGIYDRSERLLLAEKMHRRVLASASGDPKLQRIYRADLALADNLRDQGRCTEALKAYGAISAPASAAHVLRGKLSALRCVLETAFIHADLSKIADIWAQTVSVRAAAIGEAHPNTIIARQELRAVQRAAGLAALAAFKPERAKPGSLEPSTQATAFENKDYIEAATGYTLKRELSIFAYGPTAKSWLTSGDPELVSKFAALLELDAELLVEAKAPARAEVALKMALDYRMRAQGATHKDTKRTAARLAEVRKASALRP